MTARKTWRCFHCDEVFRGRTRAELHFGTTQNAAPACQIDAAKVRDMESELSKYRAEDTDLHREIQNLKGQQSAAERRAEEVGYDKGLQDGKAMKNAC